VNSGLDFNWEQYSFTVHVNWSFSVLDASFSVIWVKCV